MSTYNAWVKSDEVKLAAGRLAQDSGCENLGHAFYDAAVRDAVRELCFDTNFDERSVELDIPASGCVELPQSMGDAINIFAFNGEQCNITDSVEVHLKPNYSHHGAEGFFANQKGVNSDPLQGDTFYGGIPSNLYYGGIINCKLFLAPQVTSRYSKVRIEYAGTGSECEDVMPMVPMWAREAIQYRAAYIACLARMSENGNLFNQLANRYSDECKSARGAWVTAQVRYKAMSPKERRDVNLYNTSLGNQFAIRRLY